MSANELISINTQYFSNLRKEDIREIFKVAKNKLPELGLAASCDGHGLYRCVFPNGVTGTLAKFKDGSGNLGTIINDKGIAAQARWVEQSINPTMLFVAAALHNIEEKLEKIEETTKEIFEFEKQKEESQMAGDVKFLNGTLRDYQFSVSNEKWMNSKLASVCACEKDAEKFINEYKNLVLSAAKEKGIIDNLVHNDNAANEKINKTIEYLDNYQKAVFLHAYSHYVHVLLTENFDEHLLNNLQKDIEQNSLEYRSIFSEVSLALEKYARKTLDLKVEGVAENAVKALGELTKKIPLVNKTDINEKLIETSDKISSHKKESINNKVTKMSKYQKAPTYQFIESINTINELHNKELEVYSDDEYLYFSEPESELQILSKVVS